MIILCCRCFLAQFLPHTLSSQTDKCLIQTTRKLSRTHYILIFELFACEYGMEAFFVSKSHLFLFASFPWNPLDQCGELLLYFHVLLQRLLRPRDLHNLFPSSSTSTSTSSSSTLSLISRSISLPPVVGLKHKLSASERRGYPSALTGPPHQDQGNGVIIIRWQRTNSTSWTQALTRVQKVNSRVEREI